MDNPPIAPGPARAPRALLPGGRCVVLLHTMPASAGSGHPSHFDWLCESAAISPAAAAADQDVDGAHDDDARSLIAFRAARSPAALHAGESMALTPLPRHRRLYLHYQGPIAGDRGSVQLVAAGVIRAADDADADAHARSMRLTICWSGDDQQHADTSAGGIVQTLLLERVGESGWNLRCETRGKRAE